MRFNEDKAIYLQISEHLMQKILQGECREGERILSVRECAADLEVNPNTCVRAYDWLCERGIIFSKRGLGYYVSEGAQNAILQEQREVFLNETLPHMAQRMKWLHIPLDEVVKRLQG